MERRDKINYYLDLAEVVSQRSTCLRRHYGAVIVKNDEVIATGYVGAPRGRQNCTDIGKCIRTELNIEGYPSEEFIELVLLVKPTQVTLVPDAPDALTSSAGWTVAPHLDFLTGVVDQLHEAGIRVSIFVGTDLDNIRQAARTGTDRVELYTGPYAHEFKTDPERAIAPYIAAADVARQMGLGLNAGHDLSLENLPYFRQHLPQLSEVSIGHQLIADSLYMGLEATIKAYKQALQ